MFTGEYTHSVDAKKRIFVPARFREELGETFVVARDIRREILKVFSLEGWQNYIAPIMNQERKLSEKAIRYLHRNAVQVSPDAQGRISSAVTPTLRSGRQRATPARSRTRISRISAALLSCSVFDLRGALWQKK